MSVDGFVYVTHPPGLFVYNNITALEQYADVDVNGTYSLQTRVAFIAEIGDSLYELNFNNLIIDLKPRENDQVPNTLGVRHECAERGLIAPPLSTMFARKDETNSLVCVCGNVRCHTFGRLSIHFHPCTMLRTKTNTCAFPYPRTSRQCALHLTCICECPLVVRWC